MGVGMGIAEGDCDVVDWGGVWIGVGVGVVEKGTRNLLIVMATRITFDVAAR